MSCRAGCVCCVGFPVGSDRPSPNMPLCARSGHSRTASPSGWRPARAGGPGLFGKAGPQKPFGQMSPHGFISGGRHLHPVPHPEVRTAQHEHFGFAARLVHSAELRQTRRQDPPRAAAVGLVPAQGLDGLRIPTGGILGPTKSPEVPTRRMRIESKRLMHIGDALLWPAVEERQRPHRPGVCIVRIEA